MKNTMIGVEYELEGLDFDPEDWGTTNIKDVRWDCIHDGTLRDGGGEFVSRPMPLLGAADACKALLKEVGHYDVSHRCSMHVHIGLDGLRGWQKIAMYVLLVAHEDFFFAFDPVRKTNHFCTPLMRAPAFYIGLSQIASGPDWGVDRDRISTLNIRQPYRGEFKYSCVNTLPSTDGGIGTIELRHFSPIVSPRKIDSLMDQLITIMTLVHDVKPKGRAAFVKTLATTTSFTPDIIDNIKWCLSAIDQIAPRST